MIQERANVESIDFTLFIVMHRETLNEYRGRKGLPPRALPPPNYPRIPSRFANVKCFQIKVTESGHRVPAELKLLTDASRATRQFVKESDYYISEDSNLPDGALEFLNLYFGLPNFGGIPLARYELVSTGSLNRTWYTKKIERFNVLDSTFQSPSGFGKVSNPGLIASSAHKNKIEDIMFDMGLGEDFGKKSKTDSSGK